MRGVDHQQSDIFSYLSPAMRVRRDHPLRAIRTMVDEALANLSPLFDRMYAATGRPSIPPEKLLRALGRYRRFGCPIATVSSPIRVRISSEN